MASINLLPKRESKFNLSIIFCIVFSVLICVTGIATFIYSKYLNEQMLTLDQRYNSYVARIEEMNKASEESGVELQSKFTDLQLILDELNLYKPYTVDLFTKIIALLPEDGYIMDVQFNRITSEMNLTARFLNYKEAGYLVTRFQEEKWVNEVELSAITTAELNVEGSDEEDEKPIRFDAVFNVKVKPSEWKKSPVVEDDIEEDYTEQQDSNEQQDNQSSSKAEEE